MPSNSDNLDTNETNVDAVFGRFLLSRVLFDRIEKGVSADALNRFQELGLIEKITVPELPPVVLSALEDSGDRLAVPPGPLLFVALAGSATVVDPVEFLLHPDA